MTNPACEAAQNGAAETSPPAGPAADAETQPVDKMDHMRERIRKLPPEVGAVLMTVGVVGLILPGPIGTPLVLAGGLVLMPRTFGRWEKWFSKRFPKMHEHGMRHVDRFIDDFERRYPKQTPQNESNSCSDG
jgi:hypothetical protein